MTTNCSPLGNIALGTALPFTTATGDQTCSTQPTRFVAKLPKRHSWIFDD